MSKRKETSIFIYVKVGYKQRKDDLGGPIDKVIFDCMEGTILEIDSSVPNHLDHYEPWLITDDTIILSIKNQHLGPIPNKITMRQARLFLLKAGHLESIEQLVKANKEAEIEWEYANDLEITNPLIMVIANQLNLDQEFINTMFREAAKI